MQSSEKKIVILAAAINASNTPQIYYALITLSESGSTFVINSYCQLKHSSFYTGNVSADNLKMKFILNRNIAYVYDEKVIYQVYMNGKKTSSSDLDCHLKWYSVLDRLILKLSKYVQIIYYLF